MRWLRSRGLVALAFLALGGLVLVLAVREDSGRGSSRTTSIRIPTLDSLGPPSGDLQDHELQMLERELEKRPDHVPVLLRLAQLARESRRNSEAAEYLRRILALEPSNADARLELGRVLWESGDADGAMEETLRLLDDEPDNVDALYNLGAIYGNLGQDVQARRYWEQAVSLDPASESGRLASRGIAGLSGP